MYKCNFIRKSYIKTAEAVNLAIGHWTAQKVFSLETFWGY